MSDYDLLKDDVYSIREEGDGFRITKFDKDLNPGSVYQLREHTEGNFSCNCPQSNRGACRHMDIMDAFGLYPERLGKGWFYCYQTGDWFPPFVVDKIDSPTGPSAVPVEPAEGVVPSLPSADAVPEVKQDASPVPSGTMTFGRRGL